MGQENFKEFSDEYIQEMIDEETKTNKEMLLQKSVNELFGDPNEHPVNFVGFNTTRVGSELQYEIVIQPQVSIEHINFHITPSA